MKKQNTRLDYVKLLSAWLIDSESENLKTDIATYTKFSEMMKNAKKSKAGYVVLIEGSTVSAASSGLMLAVTSAFISSHNDDIRYYNTPGALAKPSKLLIKISSAVIVLSLVSIGVGRYQISLSNDEMEDIQRNLNQAYKQVQTRRAAILSLKEQIGIKTKNISIDTDIPNASAIVVPGK